MEISADSREHISEALDVTEYVPGLAQRKRITMQKI